MFLQLLQQTETLTLQDKSNSANYQTWTVSSAPVDNGTYFAVPVTLQTSGGTGTTNFTMGQELVVTLVNGISGYSGAAGASGVSGFSGEAGTSGFSGEAGTSGFSGEAGTSGFSGEAGASGFSGEAGTSGFSGEAGTSGFSGEAGTSGFSGYSGTVGQSGVSGYSGAAGSGGGTTFTVTNSGTTDYVINTLNDPTLNLIKGSTYTFNVNAVGHPFWIKTAQTTGTGNQYNTGVTNNGTDSGTITFTVPLDAPNTLYYICEFHSSMSGILSISDGGVGDGLSSDALSFRIAPQNSQSADYTLIASDSGKHILHPSSDANARTFTIPANVSVAYPIGTAITFVNETSQAVTIAITSDTMYLAGTGTTGSRTLAQYGVATALKTGSTTWYISGTGLT